MPCDAHGRLQHSIAMDTGREATSMEGFCSAAGVTLPQHFISFVSTRSSSGNKKPRWREKMISEADLVSEKSHLAPPCKGKKAELVVIAMIQFVKSQWKKKIGVMSLSLYTWHYQKKPGPFLQSINITTVSFST